MNMRRSVSRLATLEVFLALVFSLPTWSQDVEPQAFIPVNFENFAITEYPTGEGGIGVLPGSPRERISGNSWTDSGCRLERGPDAGQRTVLMGLHGKFKLDVNAYVPLEQGAPGPITVTAKQVNPATGRCSAVASQTQVIALDLMELGEGYAVYRGQVFFEWCQGGQIFEVSATGQTSTGTPLQGSTTVQIPHRW